MPIKEIYKGSINRLEIMDETGKVDDALMPKLDEKFITKMYKTMVLTREFDNKAFALQRQGRLGTYAQILGQEASDIASSMAMEKDDWLIPTFRNVGSIIAHGGDPVKILEYWGGSEQGHNNLEKLNITPISIPIGSQALHGMGIAWGMKYKKKKTASLVHFGDGATSTGDVQVAMNFAGSFNVPCVFYCENNQFAISVPRSLQTKSTSIAQKALAYGIEGLQVDGNDVFAVYKGTKDALDRGKKGNGPTLLEAFTYRMGHHTTADDATRYRPQEELDRWKKKDPISRLGKYMKAQGFWKDSDIIQTQQWAEKEVMEIVTKYEAIPKPDPQDIFDYVYAEPTAPLLEQKEMLKKFIEEEGEPEGH
jgi:pyruvate dehydrogenase E1 component alpha subunit